MKNGLKRAKKSPVTTTRGQVIGISRPRQRGQLLHKCGQFGMRTHRVFGPGPESFPLLLELLDAAGGAHDAQHIVDLDEDVRQENGRREMLHQTGRVESQIVVFRPGIDHEHVGQPMLGDEPFEIAHIGFADARSAAAHHVEADDLAGLAIAMDLEELSDGEGQRETLAAGGGLQAQVELAAIDGNTWPACRPSQPSGHGRGLCVVLREVEKMKFHPWVGERHSLATRRDDDAALEPAGKA